MNLNELTQQMEENNRSNYEIERHTRNARAHLLEIKKTMFASVEIQANMFSAINGLVEVLKGNALAQLEKDREMMRLLEGLGNNGGGPDEPAQFQGGDQGLGALLMGAAGALALGIGALIGQAKAISAYAKAFTPESFKKGLANMGESLRNSIKNLRLGITSRIVGLAMQLELFFDSLKAKFTPNPDGPFGKALAKVGAVFTNISNRIGKLVSVFTDAGQVIANAAEGPLAKMKSGFQTVMGYVKSFGSTVGKIAGIVGKIFAPIAILMTAWETLTGAIDGYAEGGILGGIEGAIDGFFTSLITMPLDLIKDAVAWIAGKLGFDETSEALSSFSFTDMFDKMTDAVFGFVDGIIDWLGKQLLFDENGDFKSPLEMIRGLLTLPMDAITDVIEWITSKFDIDSAMKSIGEMAGNIGDMASEFIKKLLRIVLPRPDSDAKWYDVSSIASKAIPDSVYTYAGINPETFEDIPTEAEAATPPITGAEMSATQTDIANASSAPVVQQQIINNNNNVGGDSVTVASGNPGTRREADGQLDDLVFSP